MRKSKQSGWQAGQFGGIWVALATVCLAAAAWPVGGAAGKDHYVAPNGRADGKGSKDSPLDLATTIGPSSPAKPGDTVWLRGGTYRGPFRLRVSGKKEAPVTFRAAPGERATLDCRLREGKDYRPHVDVEGDWVTLWGLEVTCSDPKRVTPHKGSSPPGIRRGGLFCRAAHARFINLVVHDCECGFGFWSAGEGGEIYGCLIYNNGWIGPDRGHGHAIYAQNKTGTKRLVDNVMFNQFSYGIHVYGSSRAFLKGFHVEGNVSFNNGSAAHPNSRTPAVLIGGGSPSERITVLNNYTYGDERGGGSVCLGYTARYNEDVTVRGNYFVGPLDLVRWKRVTFEDNTLVGRGRLLRVQPAQGAEARTSRLSPVLVARPKGAKVIVRPNRYEPGRAHVIVYNWDRKKSIAADLSGVLKDGGKYRVVSAQDFFGEPVAGGTFDGKPVKLPMRAYRAAPPIGMPEHKPPVTGPVFNVFVVLPAG